MSRLQYVGLLVGCLAVTAPLELLLGARVYRQPGRLLRTLALPIVAFVAWDAIAIHRQVWWFASRFTTGVLLPARIPLEEVAFFVVVPVCALLTFEVVERMARRHG